MSEVAQWWDSGGRVLYYVTFNLTRAVLAFLQRDSYLYWPFLVSSVILAVLVSGADSTKMHGTAKTPTTCWRFRSYFSLGLWWHRSARADYRLYFANALIFPILIAPLLLSNGNIVSLMETILSSHGYGQAKTDGATSIAIRAAFTVVFFVAYDFGRFASHSLLHDIPALWSFHKVHHSAEVLTPMTSYRVHPIEMLMMAWIPALMTGLVTWGFNRFAGTGVSFYSFVGLHVMIWAFNLIDNLRHSPVWFSYGQKLGRWLVSPAHHQVHHSIEPRHWGTNRGANLAIWDRLYGTLYVPGLEQENFRMGLGDGTEAQWHRLWTIYVQPFRESFRCVWDAVLRRVGTTS